MAVHFLSGIFLGLDRAIGPNRRLHTVLAPVFERRFSMAMDGRKWRTAETFGQIISGRDHGLSQGTHPDSVQNLSVGPRGAYENLVPCRHRRRRHPIRLYPVPVLIKEAS